jgi:hypothetical protein
MGLFPDRLCFLVPLVFVGLVMGCGETSPPEGPGPVAAASTTILGETLPVGKRPSPPVKAYWFGTKVGEAEVVLARHPFRYRYDVYYELPSAEGKTSALPGQVPLPGAIHVISLSLKTEPVRRMVEDYLPRARPLTLANGENVKFVTPGPADSGFWIVTEETFVLVLGPPITPLTPEQGLELAAGLRPL